MYRASTTKSDHSNEADQGNGIENILTALVISLLYDDDNDNAIVEKQLHLVKVCLLPYLMKLL